ncbi:ABC transporter ATP-binding protein [Lysinibacillus sp. NPDC097231]|uniref:ABC transporter ATP-binding protein n=1 Tax=Lysinibacillus sp. NPDC097231 TaxID=3364142 RepID=UPI003823843B
MDLDEEKHTSNSLNKQILFLIRPYIGRIVLAFSLVTIRSILLLSPPILTKYIIDTILPNHVNTELVFFSFCIFIIPVITGALIIWDLHVSSFVLKIASIIRTKIYSGLQNRQIRWFIKKNTSDLLQRLLDETESVTLFFYQGIGSIIWFNVTILTGILLMSFMSVKLTILLVIFLLLQVFALDRVSRQLNKNSEELLDAQSMMAEHVKETLNGIHYIKSVGKELTEVKKFIPKIDMHYKKYQKILIIKNKASISRALLNSCSVAAIFLYGGKLVIDGNLTVGSLVAISTIYSWITPAFLGYQNAILEAKSISPSINRIREIYFEEIPNIKGDLTPRSLFPIVLENVTLLDSNKNNIINDINFQIDEGKLYQISGKSGSGKSSLIDIVLGIIPPSSGKVEINGIDFHEVNQDWLRKKMFCVTQEIPLFNGTILDNLLYVNPMANNEQILRCLEITELTEWINKLPCGLNTHIGELASGISGGEKQRISIAAAILKNPSLLILDESTSALDYKTENKILNNLLSEFPGITIILVNHRDKILPNFDNIISLDQNKN